MLKLSGACEGVRPPARFAIVIGVAIACCVANDPARAQAATQAPPAAAKSKPSSPSS